VFELGYFIAKLGRKRVRALYSEGVELPSDYQGVLYTRLDPGGAWQSELAWEIKTAGIDVDLNKLAK
jgi:predicted nucleotide-binding protein